MFSNSDLLGEVKAYVTDSRSSPSHFRLLLISTLLLLLTPIPGQTQARLNKPRHNTNA